MYIQLILNLNQEENRLGNKFTDILKNVNSVFIQHLPQSGSFYGSVQICVIKSGICPLGHGPHWLAFIGRIPSPLRQSPQCPF